MLEGPQPHVSKQTRSLPHNNKGGLTLSKSASPGGLLFGKSQIVSSVSKVFLKNERHAGVCVCAVFQDTSFLVDSNFRKNKRNATIGCFWQWIRSVRPRFGIGVCLEHQSLVLERVQPKTRNGLTGSGFSARPEIDRHKFKRRPPVNGPTLASFPAVCAF